MDAQQYQSVADSNIVYRYFDSLFKQPATSSEVNERTKEVVVRALEFGREREVQSNNIVDATAAAIIRVVPFLPREVVRLACTYLELSTLDALLLTMKIELRTLK